MPSIPSLLPTPSTLTPSTLSSLLALYAPTLASHASTKRAAEVPSAPDLSALDLLRYTTIPARVRARWHDASAPSNREPKEPEDSEATDPPPDRHGWLEKEELELLVAWKLTRGHSRPTLPALVRSNAPSLVRDTTARAYALFATTVDADKADPFPALKVLAGLRGVGPATASLLLAVGWPGEVPFFADELLGWVRGRRGALRYDWREYGELWEGVRAVRERVGGGVSAEEVERGAWVVGVLGRGGGRGEGGGIRVDSGKGGELPVRQAEDAGEVMNVEKGRGKRKVEGDSDGMERSTEVPRRQKAKTLKEENIVDGSGPRRSIRNKQ